MSSDLRTVLHGAGRVVVFGDVHGDTTAFRVLAERAVEQMALTRVLISVGDFGIGPWGGDTLDKTVRRADDLLQALDAFVLITPGNHEDWDTINQAITARTDELGFGILGRHGRVRVSPRGHRFAIGGLRFGSLGGAVSVDRVAHQAGNEPGSIIGKWWWPTEAPEQADVDALGPEPLDVLITHDVPDGVPMTSSGDWDPSLMAKSNVVRVLLRDAVEATRPAVCFCGHWHRRRSHELHRSTDHGITRVEVLSEEHTTGNAVVLDLRQATHPIQALPDAWRRWLDAAESQPGMPRQEPAAQPTSPLHLRLISQAGTLDVSSPSQLAANLDGGEQIHDASGTSRRGAITYGSMARGLIMQPVLWPPRATTNGPSAEPQLRWRLQRRHSFSELDPVLSADGAATAIWAWIGQGHIPGYRLIPRETEQ